MSRVMSDVFKFLILSGMLVGLPLVGVCLAGLPVPRYLEFPPKTQYVLHADFSWIAFLLFAAAILVVAAPLGIGIVSAYRRYRATANTSISCAFPWWGWMCLVAGMVVWSLAWTRFSWFAPFQRHTFFPLWLSYIGVVNALCYWRTGHCMMLDRPVFFLGFFPASAVFWWYFEYLNRFVQNWYYVGAEYGPRTYFWLATVSFSTVLPAVLSTRELILSFGWMRNGFADVGPRIIPLWRLLPWLVLGASAVGLACIGLWPNYLFPLIWVSPFLVIVSLQAILGERHVLSDIAYGRWYPLISAALAALVCGWFWEMWNYLSLAKWEYTIPFVNRFHLFEMPVLGYAGYLPFGLECLVIGSFVLGYSGLDEA